MSKYHSSVHSIYFTLHACVCIKNYVIKATVSGVCVDCLWRLLMPCSVKKVSALLGHSQVDPAGPVLVALLGCLGWVVGWDCKPETNNSSMKVTGPSSAWSRGNNSKFQLQVTVSSTIIVWCSRADKSGCRLVYFQGRGRARSTVFLLCPVPISVHCSLSLLLSSPLRCRHLDPPWLFSFLVFC